MNVNTVMGFISSLTIFIPIFLILYFRMFSCRSFVALLIYYISIFIYNLMSQGYIDAQPALVYYWGLANNLLDLPLLLAFLLYMSPSPVFTRRVKFLIIGFIAFEVMVVSLAGISVDSITIILAPSLPIIFGFSVYFFYRQSKITITHHKAPGKALMAASLLIAYGCYAIIYLMYYVLKTTFIADSFLVYFLVTTVSCFLMAAGLFFENRRIRKLQELRIARRELSLVYTGDVKKAVTLGAVPLDLDMHRLN